ncbi:MAG: dehydrogenase [Paludibacteraceae bacterium]
MADNYLEKHYEEYEAKKAAWLKGRSKYPVRRRSKNTSVD